jgi:hypothetical protein
MATVNHHRAVNHALRSTVNIISNSSSNCSSDSSSPTALLEGVSYEQLRTAVIEMYHASSHPEETDLEDQFDDALEAMWYVEYDGEPVPIDGVDGLYVGSVGE